MGKCVDTVRVETTEILLSCEELLKTVLFSFGVESYGEKDSVIRIGSECSNDSTRWERTLELRKICGENQDYCICVSVKRGDNISFIFYSFLIKCFAYHLEFFCMEYDKQSVLPLYVDMIRKETVKSFERYCKSTLKIDLRHIIALSATYYEGEPAGGDIIFLVGGDAKDMMKVEENERITFDDLSIRKIRKNLEISRVTVKNSNSTGVSIVCDYDEKWRVIGFADRSFKEDNIRFHFVKHMVWEMYWNEELVCTYDCASYLLPHRYRKIEFQRKMMECKGKEYRLTDKLWMCIETAETQEHGTIVIVIPDDQEAKTEASRLKSNSGGIILENNCIKSEYIKDYIRGLTTVDGALILDADGCVYGYGMMLDSSNVGWVKTDTGRGSRFNSTKRYIASLYESTDVSNAVAVIVSEDGMINLFSTKDAEMEKNMR